MSCVSEESIIEIIRKNTGKMLPKETGIKSSYFRIKDLKAVIFDIYGTLFISEAGDISLADNKNPSENIFLNTFKEAGIDTADFNENYLTTLPGIYISEIKKEHMHIKKSGIEYPEVVITEIWKNILQNVTDKVFNDEEICRIAVSFETLSNKTFPMPGAENILNKIKNSKLISGIISNAQFYTPYLFNAHFGKNTDELGFDRELSLYSFEYRRGKPDPFLFNKTAAVLENKYSIKPSQVLYTGNDMLNDITAAHYAGMKTALFAGDQRSLRLRDNIPECREISPDMIITDLSQIYDIIF